MSVKTSLMGTSFVKTIKIHNMLPVITYTLKGIHHHIIQGNLFNQGTFFSPKRSSELHGTCMYLYTAFVLGSVINLLSSCH